MYLYVSPLTCVEPPFSSFEYHELCICLFKGEGYDIRHGHFSAPVRGLYLISATVLSGGTGDIRTEIMSENEQLAAMYGKTLDMGSHTVIVFLKQKEQVWVRHFNEPISNTAHSGKDRYYSSFSGVLIAAS